jgi:hypothetical protein
MLVTHIAETSHGTQLLIESSTITGILLNQFKEHLDLKMDIKVRKKLSRADKIWKKFKSHFTRAINDNKSDTGTLKAIGIANAVKEKVNQNKENQRVLAQATVEANNKIELLEKQQARNYMQPSWRNNPNRYHYYKIQWQPPSKH